MISCFKKLIIQELMTSESTDRMTDADMSRDGSDGVFGMKLMT